MFDGMIAWKEVLGEITSADHLDKPDMPYNPHILEQMQKEAQN